MNNQFRLILACLFFLVTACQEDEEAPSLASSDKEFLAFSFLAENNPAFLQEDYSFSVAGDHVNAMLPPGKPVDSLVATFTSNADVVTVDSVAQQSGTTANDFSTPVTYSLVAEDGTVNTYRVGVRTFTGLPIVYINTKDQVAITSKDDYLEGTITLIANGSGEEPLTETAMEIRGRGNSTWTMPKKPYRIKFADKTEVLDMPADKSWVLLANHSDKTLMRNHIAFELSRQFGLKYTPRSRFVEVYLNGSYDGNYQLTEQIQVDDHRLDIDELDPDDIEENKLSGGYLLEVDFRKDADFWFESTQGESFTIKSPEDMAPEQQEYIRNYVQTTENIIFSENFADPQEGYAQYIDIESFVDWYLINEITKNTDGNFKSSVYLHKPRGGKLFMGPIWDFDIALGNVDFGTGMDPEGWRIREVSWFKRLFEDPAFRERVNARWNELKDNEIKEVVAEIDDTADYLAVSQTQNFERWKILDIRVWPNPVVTGSYAGEVAYLKDWLDARIEWMDYAINNP